MTALAPPSLLDDLESGPSPESPTGDRFDGRLWAILLVLCGTVFLVERLLGAALTGIAQISPTWESRAIFVGLLDDPPDRLVRNGIPQGGAAIVRLAIVTALSLAIANWRLRHIKLSGASD